MTCGDAEIEPLLFPVLYPWGQGYWQAKPFHEHQPFQDTRLEDAKIKLSSFIPHYHADHYWPAWTYLEIEAHRILQNSLRLISTQQQQRRTGRITRNELIQQSTYGNWNIIDEKLTNSIPKFIRTGDTFFIEAEQKIRAMLMTYNIPQLFITTTFSERWPEYQSILLKMSCDSTLPSNCPWEAIQYYQEQWYWLKKEYLRQPTVSRFGTLREIVERHEFQLRAAIHTHSLLWTLKSIDTLIAEDFICADILDPIQEPKLYQLVMQHQIHRCQRDLCGLGTYDGFRCAKGFPADLSEKTYQRPHELRYTYRRLKEEDR